MASSESGTPLCYQHLMDGRWGYKVYRTSTRGDGRSDTLTEWLSLAASDKSLEVYTRKEPPTSLELDNYALTPEGSFGFHF